MALLVEDINRAFAGLAPEYITDPKHAIFRIYRDTRFSADKRPYKIHIAAWFRRQGMERHRGAGFYVHFSPEELLVAGGIHQPDREETAAIRAWLVEHHEELTCAAARARRLMGPLEGEELSRMPKGFAPDAPALIKKKEWLCQTTLDPAVGLTAKLGSEIIRRFRVMLPVVEALNRPLLKRAKLNQLPDYW